MRELKKEYPIKCVVKCTISLDSVLKNNSVLGLFGSDSFLLL